NMEPSALNIESVAAEFNPPPLGAFEGSVIRMIFVPNVGSVKLPPAAGSGGAGYCLGQIALLPRARPHPAGGAAPTASDPHTPTGRPSTRTDPRKPNRPRAAPRPRPLP